MCHSTTLTSRLTLHTILPYDMLLYAIAQIILMFAAIACRLFADFDRFHNLPAAWLSLFELATTVVNPSIWLPMVREMV